MSFGFSPGDIVMLGNFLLKVREALKENDGSRDQYCRAMNQCSDFEGVLDSIQGMDLSNAIPSFKAQLEKCVLDTQSVINEFRQTVARYKKSLGENSSRGKIATAPRKIQWAFAAADNLDEFRRRLQSQVNRIQIILQRNSWEIIAKLERRTQFLDKSPQSSLIPGQKPVLMDGNKWMAGGITVPLLGAPTHQDVDFIDLRFQCLFSNESPPRIREMGRVFTLPDDEMAITSLPPLPISPLQAPNTESAPRQRKAHAPPCTGQPKASALPPKRIASMNLQGDVSEPLQYLNLEELSPTEAQQLQTTSVPQLLLPAATESITSIKSTACGDEASSAREKKPSTSEKPRKSRRFAIPKFSGTDMISHAISLAASLLATYDATAQLTTQGDSFDEDKELARFNSAISKASDDINMATERCRKSLPGETQSLTLALGMESECVIADTELLLRGLRSAPTCSAALNFLSSNVKFQVFHMGMRPITQTLEHLDGRFLFVLQIHRM